METKVEIIESTMNGVTQKIAIIHENPNNEAKEVLIDIETSLKENTIHVIYEF